MPFTRNQDIKIYYEVEGQGPPIILAHGVTGNVAFWTGYGYVDQWRKCCCRVNHPSSAIICGKLGSLGGSR